MPRTRSKPNSVIASAARLTAGRKRNIPRTTGAGWQDEVWEMVDQVGELGFYGLLFKHALSRCSLYVGTETPDGEVVRDTDGPAVEALGELFGGEDGQSQMLGAMGQHISLVGETWLAGLVNPPDSPDDPDQWRVLSPAEIRVQGSSGWQIERGDGAGEVYTDDEIYVNRIWTPHPKYHVEAASSVRSALPALRKLVGLDKASAAMIDSRLAGAGILCIPTEATFEATRLPDQDPETESPPELIAAMIEVMGAALEDRADPASHVPIILRMPAQYIKDVQHISFAQAALKDTDQESRAVKRLATALDIPAEVLTGLADVNHWTGWLAAENTIKMHWEPTLGTIVHGLTTRWLWPSLQGGGSRLTDEIRSKRVFGDTSRLRERPNKADQTKSMHDDLLVTDAALIRETGLDSGDLLDPTSGEYLRRVLQLLVRSGSPEIAIQAAAALGAGIELQTPVSTTVPAPAIEAPAPAPVEDRTPPVQPDTPPEAGAALIAVAELAVHRAVERAWNRIGQRGKVRGSVNPDRLDAALAGAWDTIGGPATLLGMDEAALTASLDSYTRLLLTTGDEFDQATLAAHLGIEWR